MMVNDVWLNIAREEKVATSHLLPTMGPSKPKQFDGVLNQPAISILAPTILATSACNVDDDEQQQHGPEQRLEGIHQRGHQRPQCPHESHNPQGLHDPQQPRHAQQAQDSDRRTDAGVARRSKQFDDDVGPGGCDNHDLPGWTMMDHELGMIEIHKSAIVHGWLIHIYRVVIYH